MIFLGSPCELITPRLIFVFRSLFLFVSTAVDPRCTMADHSTQNKRQKTRTTEWKVFDPSKYSELDLTSTVFFRSKSAKEKGRRGRLVVPPLAASASDEDGGGDVSHCQVQWIDSMNDDENTSDTTKTSSRVSRKRLLPVYETSDPSSAVLVLVTQDTARYRLLAASQVSPTDHVLELGCSTGETSVILWRYAKSWVGYDTGAIMIATVQERLATLRNTTAAATADAYCIELNALTDSARGIQESCRFHADGPTTVFIDIGGNRQETAVLRMLQWILDSFGSVHTVIIKSLEVYRAIRDDCNAATTSDFNGDAWFRHRLQAAVAADQPKHPLQAAKILSPADGRTPICRYYNYYPAGCAKGDNCPFDHEFCHSCLVKGHVARRCPLLEK